MHVAVAPVCAHCRVAIAPSELHGIRRGRCPRCGPDVQVIQVAVDAPMTLVATFPEPRPPPSGMALERAEPAPQPTPVGDGPFRTPGRLRVERQGTAVRIRLPSQVRGLAAGLAVSWTGALTALAILTAAPGTLPVVLGFPALCIGFAKFRKQSWIELSPTSVWVQRDGHITHRIDRARITHIRCVCPNPTGYGPPDVPWEVWVTADGVPTPLVTANSLEHATAIAELLVHELGLPTWVPVPTLQSPPRW